MHELKVLHHQHRELFKGKVLEQLRELTPTAFERFGRRLLEVYGFENVVVTAPTNDKGIDGHGRLKVGLAHMDAAFQCKRWRDGCVGRPEIDKFRGAIQGDYAQGVFFTTARFSDGAKAVSMKRGAVPVVLIDGPAIVDIMIDKMLGVEHELLPVYTYSLDGIVSSD